MYPFGPPPPPQDPKKPEPEAQEPAEPAGYDEDETIDELLEDKTARWRAERLLSHGMTPFQARTLALNRSVDVHYVIERLIQRGCDPYVAFDIAS